MAQPGSRRLRRGGPVRGPAHRRRRDQHGRLHRRRRQPEGVGPGRGGRDAERPSGGSFEQAAALTPQPLNSWTEFVQKFGEIQTSNRYLAHAVYGFFDNGGTRCFVARVAAAGDLAKGVDTILGRLESIDEVALVAAPLPPDVPAAALTAVQAALVAHCGRMEDRFAILDSVCDVTSDNLVISTDDYGIRRPAADPKGYGAFYFPWIEVADPLGRGRAGHGPAERAPRRHLRPQRRHPRGPQGARQRGGRRRTGHPLPGEQDPRRAASTRSASTASATSTARSRSTAPARSRRTRRATPSGPTSTRGGW